MSAVLAASTKRRVKPSARAQPSAGAPSELLNEIFNAVAEELAKSLDHFGVPAKERGEVLAAFAAHKNEVTA